MRILIASSEIHPYSKSGGLGDMVGALAKFLGRAGHHVGVVTPLYRDIPNRFPEIKRFDWHMDLPLGVERVQAGVQTLEPSDGVTIYFIEQSHFYDRAGLYAENNWDYPDNPHRFIFFSKCAAHLARYLPWKPQLVHAHDWQAGLVPILIQHQKLAEGWGNPPSTCFSIHNLAYQGNYARWAYDLTNLPLDYFNPNGIEFYGRMSLLKAGIAYADLITTVSPRYAREITTPEFGCGLDGILRARQKDLLGILNGVDYDEWNTTRNPHLRQPYSARNLEGKNVNKLELQKEFGLPLRPDVPLFGNITRLADQKGVDLMLGALEEMLASDIQFVLLGSGDPYFERAFHQLARRFPDKAAITIGFDQGLSHRIEAGSDFYLMPSRYEPCGLNQMYSLRYGTVPVVRATGGLDDSVIDITESLNRANGIKFKNPSTKALSKATRKALALYEHPDLLTKYRKRGMTADFSWERTAEEYAKVFAKLTKE
jgi:starch synthase